MRSNILLYKIIATASFLILVSVQFFLVYNTYKLKDEHFFLAEKNLINDSYSKSVRNDKVYPGAQRIIDKYFARNMNTLENLYIKEPNQFAVLKEKMCDSIFSDLRAHSNMDSVFASIIKKNSLNSNLQYRLVISSLSVAFSNNRYIPLYQPGAHYKTIDSVIQTPEGILIDGHLQHPAKQNQVTALTVSSPADHTYQLGFALYVDSPNRQLVILQQMKPTFALSVLSILAVALIYFYTFRNWLRQKKIADMKSDFVNSITHEFNTPLATIIVANRNLQNEKVLEKKENIGPLTHIIERQAQRLKTLFSSVLDITLMNESTLQKKQYFLNDLLDEILLDYRLKSSDSDIEISFAKDAQNHRVLLDKFWFTTMLLNIFDNALKYNRSPVKKITVTTVDKPALVEIHVSDNGIGMSPRTLEHIFEKFYRSKGNNKEEVSGIGLGLFYARQCIDAHKWQMQVNSKEGNGSEFIILMPPDK